MKITRSLRDTLHGYIMSDGYVKKGTLTVEQGHKQIRFVYWLYNKFIAIRTQSSVKCVTLTRIGRNGTIKTQSYRFFTRAVLHGFHYMWYQPVLKKGKRVYKKKLPTRCEGFFSPTFLAIWYAGNGTKVIGSLGVKFEVTCFSVVERLCLKKLFKKKYNISAVIIKSGLSKKKNTLWALKIGAKDYWKFHELVAQHPVILHYFSYKLHKKTP